MPSCCSHLNSYPIGDVFVFVSFYSMLFSLFIILGYYADVEARCQVFRVCANTDLTGRGSTISLIFYNFKHLLKRRHKNRFNSWWLWLLFYVFFFYISHFTLHELTRVYEASFSFFTFIIFFYFCLTLSLLILRFNALISVASRH